jgi:hypothetical protein
MIRPSDTGFAPSTSLPGWMASLSSASRAPAGSGVAAMIPCTDASALHSVSAARIRATVSSGCAVTRSITSQPTPTLAAAAASDRTYHALASSAVAVTTASRGARPAAVSSAARAAVPARISAASSRPDSGLTG